MTLVECVPNFSEGRRPEVVAEIAGVIAATPGVTLLDTQSDAHHNRCVITFVGEAAAAQEGAFRAIAAAARLIDLTRHEGAHPRFGATDVVPFVPVRADDMAACVEAAHRLGARVGPSSPSPSTSTKTPRAAPSGATWPTCVAASSRACARPSPPTRRVPPTKGPPRCIRKRAPWPSAHGPR